MTFQMHFNIFLIFIENTNKLKYSLSLSLFIFYRWKGISTVAERAQHAATSENTCK